MVHAPSIRVQQLNLLQWRHSMRAQKYITHMTHIPQIICLLENPWTHLRFAQSWTPYASQLRVRARTLSRTSFPKRLKH